MINFKHAAAAVFAVAALAGCPTTGGIPGMPTTGASTTPGAAKGPDAALAAQCSAASPAATPVVGAAKHGKYSGQNLPNGWDNLDTEAKVTESIDKFKADAATGAADKVNQWNCFNKFYGGALTVYYGIKGM